MQVLFVGNGSKILFFFFYFLQFADNNDQTAVVATLSLSCALHYYGSLCSVHCEPPSDRHHCDQATGELKCAEVWTGRNCDQNGEIV